MRFSVFTPTHRPDHLLEAYRSLTRQAIPDWEWVLVPNNGCQIPDEILLDTRVKVVSFESDKVGQLKRFACANAEGEILVELDHDDMLEPTALQDIGNAVDAGAGFVYSDFVNFRPDGTCEVYETKYGWEHYPHRGYTAHRAFPADASSLSAIFFAPNHVRAWTREAYESAGGHDASMSICDDYDLVCRTYLAGFKFTHIPRCLYLYRLHDGSRKNTYIARNAEIQAKQEEVGDKYRHLLIAEWCQREKLPMYDLGGGTEPAEGFKSVDIKWGAHVVCNIRNGLPMPDNSVGAIRASDFLEHIPHCRDSTCSHQAVEGCVVFLMNEIYRVLAPGGWLISATPSTDGRGAFQDPTHCSFWNSNSTFYYTRQEQAKFVPGSLSRFKTMRIQNTYPNDWAKTHHIVYLFWDAVALKGQRQAGLCEI